MPNNRVIVVLPKAGSEVLKVLASKPVFEDWLEQSNWTRDQLNVRNCHVTETIPK